MEWSVPDGEGRFKVSLQDGDDAVSTTSISLDGSEIDAEKITVRKEGKAGRVLVEIGEEIKLVHVARTESSWWVHIDGRAHEVRFHEHGTKGPASDEGSLVAPMPGTILDLLVEQGQRVRKGQALMVLEAMKMEHRVSAPKAGEITKLHFKKGDRVEMGSVLIEIGD